VSGVHGPQAASIEAVLVAAARRMSTLHVNSAALRAAAAPFAVVREVQASPEFPHGLRIRVIEQLPVAALTVEGTRTAVAADGVVLGPALLSASLPSLSGAFAPAVGQRVGNTSLRGSLTLLGAAPPPLERLVKSVFAGPKGLTVAMRNGLLAYFGDATRPHAKWLSLARVLADQGSAGASYVDVRLPARPAAGFPSGVAPLAPATAEGGSSGSSTSTSESAVAALAAGLTAGQAGATTSSGAPATGQPAEASSGTTSTETSSPSSSSSEAPSGASAPPAEGAGEGSGSAPTPGG
jgi:cell division protein FtsQ